MSWIITQGHPYGLVVLEHVPCYHQWLVQSSCRLLLHVILFALSPHSLPFLTVTTIKKKNLSRHYTCVDMWEKFCINVLIMSLFVSSGCRTLCRVSKLPGRRVLCGSLSQRCEGGPANCVEVQQRYRTLSALQHQLYTVVSGHTSHTQAHSLPTQWEEFHTERFSVSAALWWMRGAVPSIPGQGEILFIRLLLFQVFYLD